MKTIPAFVIAITLLLSSAPALAANRSPLTLMGAQSVDAQDATAAFYVPSSNPDRPGRNDLQPNTRFAEKARLKSFCFSPVDAVVHYIGANIDEETVATGEEDTLAAPPTLEPGGWSVLLGAGVERKLSKRAAFDIDYRYSSSPVELDFESLRLPSGHEHQISAGMEFYF